MRDRRAEPDRLSHPREQRIAALEGLAATLELEAKPAVFSALFDHGPQALRAAAFEHAAKLGAQHLFDRLLQIARRAEDTTASDIVNAFLRSGHRSLAEPPLIDLLDHPLSPVAAHAADALGEVGTIVAVSRLEQCSRGLTRDRRLKHAAARAVERIQRELRNAAPGQISIVDRSPAGSLSHPPAEAGALSHADFPARAEARQGALSLRASEGLVG